MSREVDNRDRSRRIEALRRRFGMTREDLAAAIGVTVATVNRWEAGEAQPSQAVSWRLAELAKRRGLF